jgi:hypothetical protein
VGIFDAETFEVDDRRPVGFEIVIKVTVVEQIRWIQNPSTILDREDRSRNVESIDKHMMRFVITIFVVVFMHRDTIATDEPPGARRLRDRVIHDSPVPIFAQYFKAFGIGILPILNEPKAALGIE